MRCRGCGGWALCTSFIARAPTRFPTAMRSSPAARSPSGGRRVIATCARHWRRSHGRGRRGRRISARWCTGWSGDGDHAARAQPAHDDRQAGGGLTATPTKTERCSGAVGARFQLSAIPDPEASIAEMRRLKKEVLSRLWPYRALCVGACIAKLSRRPVARFCPIGSTPRRAPGQWSRHRAMSPPAAPAVL